ncbi:MAG: M20 family metallopeptidase [Candidatus Omnitrophota bacterium]|jgi:acetylornithine deacetylase/succinyl-diaminopimelate desuccinylase family protein
MINRKRLVKLTQDLIRINSENPPGDESLIAVFVKDYLKKLGLKIKIYEFKRKRPNVIAYLNGTGKSSLLITPHLDTVPSGKSWRINPFAARIIKGRIYGLGATDCKCNLASLIEAINSIVEEGVVLPYNLIFAATADEESGSRFGLIPLLNKRILKPDAALVLDADGFDIITTQKGLLHLKVRVKGKKAHGAYPDQGVNAVDIAMAVIRDIKGQKFSYRKHKYLKPPTVNLGTIRGGDKVNVVADWCEFELDFRLLPGMKAETILNTLKKILSNQAKNFSRLTGVPVKAGTIEIEGVQKSYDISEKHLLVNYLKDALRAARIIPLIKGSEGATVLTFFQEKGIPAIATGFGVSACAHIADEYVKINDLYKGTLALEKFLKIYQ